jgi:hypothetical protein
VADDVPLFREGNFGKALLYRIQYFHLSSLRQLHQWHLWQKYEELNAGLPEVLVEKCRNAYINSDNKLYVNLELAFMGLNPVESYLTSSGYKLDALVQINGTEVGIEVDGPCDFIGRKPIGGTLLKRRQVTAIDKIPLLSVPYWEWEELGNDRIQKSQFLRSLFRLNSTTNCFEENHNPNDVSFDAEVSSDLDNLCTDNLCTVDKFDKPPDQDIVDLEALTVPELKGMLQSEGLKVGGRKSELIERLEMHKN